MVKTIGNPLSWGAKAVAGAGSTAADAAAHLGEETHATPVIRTITTADLREAVRRGIDDFSAVRSDVIFLVVIYPILGVLLAFGAARGNMLPLVFPLTAGFTLLGPLAGVALYEISRCREAGAPAGWGTALSALRARAVAPVLVLGGYLLALFVVWLFVADVIWRATLGPEVPASVGAFLGAVLTTPAGWAMIILGFAVGFVFAAVALVISLVSFPMVVDRPVGVSKALVTSLQVARKNPVTVATWGLFVAVVLAASSVPAFLGLVVSMPILGHATWHLYRAAVSYEG